MPESSDVPLTLVDTHCHLDFNRFDDDREAVINRALDAGVQRIIVPGLDLESSRAAISLAEQNEVVYAAIGFHPNSLGDSIGQPEEVLPEIRELAGHPKVVAIGEIGLDYYWNRASHQIQHRWLEAQLNLASELGLPAILHNREATPDVLNLLRVWADRDRSPDLVKRRGVLHSFSGTLADALAAIDMGFYVGFTGPLTYKKADDLREVAQQLPHDRILIETDAPFLTPHPYRGERNEPAYVRYVADKLADVRGVSLPDAAALTSANADRLFHLGLAA